MDTPIRSPVGASAAPINPVHDTAPEADRFVHAAVAIAALGALLVGHGTGVLFAASAVGAAFATTVGWLVAARVASGIGIGIASSIPPRYIAERVPASLRGEEVAVNMQAITTGIVVACLVDYARSAGHDWRTLFGLAALLSIGLVVGVLGLENRGVAMSTVTVTHWALSLRVAITFLKLVSRLGQAVIVCLYGLIAATAWILRHRLVPKTRGRSLEQIEAHWLSGATPRQM